MGKRKGWEIKNIVHRGRWKQKNRERYIIKTEAESEEHRQRDKETWRGYLFLSFVYSTALNKNGLTVPLRGGLDVLAETCWPTLLLLLSCSLRMKDMCTHLHMPGRHARPSHRAQNPLTRTEQGSTGHPLIRMTKLYCFHTNTQMHGQTKAHT